MADQSLATQDQHLTIQDADSKLERAKRLLSPKAILAWALVLWTIIKFLYQGLNFASVVEFAAGLGRNPHVQAVLDFILSPWGQVLTTLLGIAWLTYLVIKPQKAKTETPERVKSEQPRKLPVTPEKPTIEILSPFDHDEVGLYEIVRGRVFPPNQELQVAVFAGDKRWYLQDPVIVRGSTWSVKCKFGRRDKPDKGPYKVIALFGNELKEGIQYPELPTTISKSNVIIVHRPEVTIEQELLTAGSERDHYKKQLQSATNAFEDMEARVEALTTEKSKLERELITIKKDKHALEQSLKTRQSELAEARATAETKEFQRMGILLEKNMLAAKVEELEEAIKLVNQKLKQEEIQSSNWMRLGNEAERKLNGLQWMVDILAPQERALQRHVVIMRDFKVRVDLIDTGLGPPRIRFGFKIRNEALPNITIHETGVGGNVYFRDHPLTETCRFDPTFASNVKNIEHKAEGELYLDQKLTAAEIDRISKALEFNPNAEFSFEHVIIKVSGGDNFRYEATEPLHIPGDYQRVKLSDCQINSNTEHA